MKPGLETRLAMAQSQLVSYAQDLKRMLAQEQEKSRELEKARDRLQSLDRLKTDFLRLVSHELRTPLNQLSAVWVLDGQLTPEEQAEFVEVIRAGYRRLAGLVERVLGYLEWVSTGKRATAETTDLVELARRVAAEVEGLDNPAVDFQLSAAAGAARVRGNEEDLAKVVRCLLENALKFSLQQKIIRAEITVAGQGAVLAVSDQGRGFPSEMAEQILTPMTVPYIENHSQGLGLSLALANAIVGAYGGRMRAFSEGRNRGARFEVELPAAEEAS